MHAANSRLPRTFATTAPLLVRLERAAYRHPGWVVAAGMFVFTLVWLLELDQTSLVPPVDNIEQLTWSRGLAWGYYKHPPLPTFLMWLAVHVTGLNAWTSYLLGAATILGGMAILWQLLRELRGLYYANLGLLAALCITFYDGRLNYYNHNTVLLVLVAATAFFTWRAFDRGQLGWWVAIGVAIGLGALAKYQIAVTALSLALFWLAQAGWRQRVHRLGALLALLIALVISTPHMLWLRTHDFGPITYAMDSSLGAGLSSSASRLHALHWLADAVFNRAAPALILLGAVGWISVRRGAPTRRASADPQRLRASRQLLFAWGAVPLLFVTLLGMVSGAELQLQWGTSFLLFLVPCVMELASPGFWDEASQRVAWGGFAILQVLLLAINIGTSPRGWRVDHHWRTFSAARLEKLIAAHARQHLGGPIRVIVGSPSEAGALALILPEKPVVLIKGRYDYSPWVSPELVAACGALQIEHARVRPAGFDPVGPAFPRLYWRVLPPTGTKAECRTQAGV